MRIQPKDMTRAGRVADISCIFAGRNSLLAGNLTGNLQNPAEFPPFWDRARLDRVTCQGVRHEFPVPGETGNFFGITGNFCR
jgi:hypothetical protein